MSLKGYYIFCDESVKQDRHYSNFYGGTMIARSDFKSVNNILVSKMQDLEMEDSELKWSNINAYRVDAYCEMMDVFFRAVSERLVKVRIMFTDNRFVPIGLKEGQQKIEYQLLYYQFIKHSFGFAHLE